MGKWYYTICMLSTWLSIGSFEATPVYTIIPSTPILSFLIGILAAVGNFTVHPQQSSILLTWDPPFSLDITGVDPDLWYCVEVYNISRGGALLTSNCSVYEPQFYFNATNPSSCHKFEFTAFAVNAVGNGSVASVNGTFFKGKYQHNISFSHFTCSLRSVLVCQVVLAQNCYVAVVIGCWSLLSC